MTKRTLGLMVVMVGVASAGAASAATTGTAARPPTTAATAKAQAGSSIDQVSRRAQVTEGRTTSADQSQSDHDRKQQKEIEKAQRKDDARERKQQEQQAQQARQRQAQQARLELDQQRRHDQRLAVYSRQQVEQQRLSQQRQQLLQQQQRAAQLTVQLRYQEQLREDQLRLRDSRSFEYSPRTYRYARGGRYYETTQHGADMLQQAINLGYAEGVRAGQSDRSDHWRADYRNSHAYRDATFGYDGYYVDLSEYRYYFREGVRRGYDDGYYSRHQYGSYSNGEGTLSGTVFQAIITLQRR